MKKLYTLFTLAAAATMTLSAQQLPNSGFEDNWGDCVPWTSNNNSKTQGQQPGSWKMSHVIGMSGTGATDIGSKDEGYNSASSVKLINTANPYKKSQIVPAYLTLGTPWATSKGGLLGDPTNKDGGTFGGLEFTYRPDAVSFMYKRSHGSSNASEKASVVSYIWKGSTSQASVPGENKLSGSLSTVTMTDRDRNILDITTSEGGAITKSSDFELISKINYDINGDQSNWTALTIPFEYNSANTPAKFNIVFCAGDYFSTTPGKDNTLHVDDVKLIYYSRLASLTINGNTVNGFASDKYDYTIDSEMPAESAFSYTTMGNSGSGVAAITLDAENAKATITVTNSNAGGTDTDGQTRHVYTLQFQKATTPTEPEGTAYQGNLSIVMNPDGGDDKIDLGTQSVSLYIANEADGTVTVTLPNFSLDLGEGEQNLGNIVVEGVTATTADGKTTYSGSTYHMELLDGGITANVDITGTNNNGVIYMVINVNWVDPDTDEVIAPIKVTFANYRLLPGEKFDGALGIVMFPDSEDKAEMDPQTVSIYLLEEEGGTVQLTLPDFSLDLGEGPQNLGDIIVGGINVTTAGDNTTYNGSVYHFSLMDGGITANIEVTGTRNISDVLTMIINVNWIDPDTDEVIAPILVTFNGTHDLSGIETVIKDNINANSQVEYYNINGYRVNSENMAPGIYIRRQGNDVKKILVR